MKSILLGLFLCFFAVNSYGEEYRKVEVYTADWCPPCRLMKKELQNNKKLKDYIDDNYWKLYYVDMTSQPLSKYGLSGVPTIRTFTWDADKKKWIKNNTLVGYKGGNSLFLFFKGDVDEFSELGVDRSGNEE